MPLVVGVPDIAPAALRFIPPGSAPEITVHAYGATPPLTVRFVAGKATPAVPFGSELAVVETVGGGTKLTESEAFWVPALTEVAVTTAVEDAVTLGGA